MSESIANRDAAFECLDIAKAALRAGDHARAEKFSQKALKLYRCQQTESMLLQVQVFISELTRGGGGPSASTPAANGHSHHSSSHDQRRQHQQQQQQHNQQQQQHNRTHSQQQQREQQQSARHSQQQQHSGSSNQQQHPRGMGGSDGLRHRQQQQQKQAQEDPSVTPEQRQVVQQILAAKGFYDVLGVPKGASEADIKQAYRKLALRLHPDKNKALHADEAFKLLSKAFSCLSSPDKRAYYDRTGYENSSAAQAAAASSGSRRGAGAAQYYYSGPDDLDPEAIFNMFFGGGGFGGHSRVFRSHFGGHPAAAQQRAQRPPSREEQQRGAMMGLMQLLPVLLVVGLTLFSSSGEPSYSLVQDTKFAVELQTQRMGVNFYVKDAKDFETTFPSRSNKRLMLERQVESDMYERVYQRCQNERMAQHRTYTWGNRDAARRMELASCKELGRMNSAMTGSTTRVAY
ncbi:DnaJ-like protein [Scenedesmus sp. NREL 46B-D3]|nr:DnaJ-like protein [Scenedesmus sp. NREL 46B-D3]